MREACRGNELRVTSYEVTSYELRVTALLQIRCGNERQQRDTEASDETEIPEGDTVGNRGVSESAARSTLGSRSETAQVVNPAITATPIPRRSIDHL
jgi:hypothetical protein